MRIDRDTPVAMLTVGQLQEVLGLRDNQKETVKEKNTDNYVFGLAGIRKLFNVSHATAQRYKDSIIADAVSQQGKIIVTDADMAMKLFNQHKGIKK